jgi:hypothetical protein
MTSRKKNKSETRRIEFPCGFTVRTDLPKGEYGPGDEIARTFSTKKCFSCKRHCTNEDGHAGDQPRLGTETNPHVDVECVGEVQISMKDDLEIRWARNRANESWPGMVDEVFWVEEHVFRAVDLHRETVGYVLARGAPAEYITQDKTPWVFLRLP